MMFHLVKHCATKSHDHFRFDCRRTEMIMAVNLMVQGAPLIVK